MRFEKIGGSVVGTFDENSILNDKNGQLVCDEVLAPYRRKEFSTSAANFAVSVNSD